MAGHALDARWIVLLAATIGIALDGVSQTALAKPEATAAAAAAGVKSTEPLQGPGLGDPGKLIKLQINPQEIQLHGSESRRQLVVDGRFQWANSRSDPAEVTYQLSKPGVVAIDSNGFVTPLADGVVKVSVKATGGATAEASVTVVDMASELPINFGNEIVPVFTKLGCNAVVAMAN